MDQPPPASFSCCTSPSAILPYILCKWSRRSVYSNMGSENLSWQ